MGDEILQRLALKLGISSPVTLRKAAELKRLLSVSSSGQLALTASAKDVICLETAAFLTGASLDKKLAIQLSGVKRTQYVGLSETVRRVLGISSGTTVADVCVTHSATAASELAQRVLRQYEATNRGATLGDVDTSLPLYQTAAVVAACKVQKVKVDQRRLYESSRSKRAVYQRLVEVMTKIAQELQKDKGVKVGSKRKKTLIELVEDKSTPEKYRKEEKVEEEGKEEEYEEWKKKILEAAAAVAAE